MIVFSNPIFEVTSQKLTDRRTSMLNSLAAIPAQNVDAVLAHIIATLETNSNDIPLAMLYKFEKSAGPTVLQLQGFIGLPEGHSLLIGTADIDSSQGLIPDMRRAGSETIFIDYDDRFELADWKGWGSPSKKIAILSITSIHCRFGYLVIGLNPYRPFDDSCRQFVRDLNRMVSIIVSAAIDFGLTQQRQEQLRTDLAFSDLKIRHLVDHASVGMCHVSLDGQMLWANDRYYRLAGKSAVEHATKFSFYDVYLEEDQPKVKAMWDDLVAGVEHVSVEFRLKRLYTSPNGEDEPAQIQILGFPYRDPETGQVKSIMACTTDISRLKWAESFHARSAAEAREAKRQQEAFIDVVSHEMRNPLGAIMHCADAIVAVVEDCQPAEIPAPCQEALHDNAQSAKIVLQCANHQKRILDDVLTLSKLSSMLLSITPVAVEPSSLIDSIMNMFRAELESHSIRHKVVADPSLSDLAIDQVYLDPSRVTQVFINLLTNAIKFVKLSDEPSISIRFGACRSDPRDCFPINMFWAENKQSDDVTNEPEWGSGEHIYLTFTVQDSGIGLQDQDIARIFQRFQQANTKTHVTYGGSGLGLYISKELVEKQGGQIGVSSIPGLGSTFGFYIKTRRTKSQLLTGKAEKHSKSVETPSHQFHVLLVEDNIVNQQVLSKHLRRAGYIVEIANHGIEALEILEKKTFDVVVMDSEVSALRTN
jgi:signal transduction histidine kinase